MIQESNDVSDLDMVPITVTHSLYIERQRNDLYNLTRYDSDYKRHF